ELVRFFSSCRRRHTRSKRDWSSDVCSSDLPLVAGSPERVVILLAASNGFGFIAGAVIGAFLLRRKLGNLGGPEVMSTTYWAVGASLVGLIPSALLMWFMNWLLPDSAPSVVFLFMLAITG